MAETKIYTATDYSLREQKLVKKFILQRDDARKYFLSCIKPRLDRSYKLYIAYNGDRAREIEKWQANVTVPYIQAVVETLMPRILDARPEFRVQGRTEDDQARAPKLQQLNDFTWEIARGDRTLEDIVRSALVYGTGYCQTYWKKDVRERKFLNTKDLLSKKLTYTKKKKTFYDAPYVEWVDNYALWYDWHNVTRDNKQYWFKRLILAGETIKRKYPSHDKKKMEMALASNNSDLIDYASIRNEVKSVHEGINKGDDYQQLASGLTTDININTDDPDLKMHEVFEWWRPHDDEYAVFVNEVPVLKGGSMPIPYDVKESPFIEIPYMRMPNEFEGYGIPMVLENPQIMLNMIKNQRLDSTTMSIHKMWIVNPLANIKKEDLVTRPFGIIYSVDPNGVKDITFGDIKQSAYKEEEMLKNDMRYASGVDDFSMGVGGGAGSATEIRHLRESTLERIRLFINHLGDGLSVVLRHWMSMYRQFFTEEMTIRIIGDDGKEMFPLIEKDDLKGEFDYKALVVPSIAGQNDVEKKQGMDLFQLLIQLDFIDPKKLTSKILRNWNWSLESVSKNEQEQPPMMPGMMGAQPGVGQDGSIPLDPNGIPIETAKGAMDILGSGNVKFLGEQASPFSELASPVNLLEAGGIPPTAGGIRGNPRGLNRGGGVNTNINQNQNSNPLSALLNRTFNTQS